MREGAETESETHCASSPLSFLLPSARFTSLSSRMRFLLLLSLSHLGPLLTQLSRILVPVSLFFSRISRLGQCLCRNNVVVSTAVD